jgi:hypothetical protein
VTTIIRDSETIDRALQHGVIALTEDEAHTWTLVESTLPTADVPRRVLRWPGDTLTLASPCRSTWCDDGVAYGGSGDNEFAEPHAECGGTARVPVATVKVVALVGSDKVSRGIDAGEMGVWVLHGDPSDPVALLLPHYWLDTLDLSLGWVAVVEKEDE